MIRQSSPPLGRTARARLPVMVAVLCAVGGAASPLRRWEAQRAAHGAAHGAGVSPAAASLPPAVTPAIPTTPAGVVFRAWLDAFNSADTARMQAFFRRHAPEDNLAIEVPFRAQTGGFTLLAIMRSAPRHLEFLVRERNSPTTAYGVMGASDDDPPRMKGFTIRVLGPNVTPADLRLDAAGRARVVAGAAAALDTFYVFPDVARRMGDSLRARLARGAYNAEDNGVAFAERLGDELGALSHDKHLRVNFSAQPLPPAPAAAPTAEPVRTPEALARGQAQMDSINCAFEKAERLAGDVGYLKFDGFADPALCAATASAAMSFVAGTRALIIDLRENGGGDPAMVAYLASYLFDRRTHLNDLWTRHTGKTEVFWTRDSVPGRRFGGTKPVYVLTAARTFSGAEEFAYDLQTQKRATIVGETTRGGAHPVDVHRIDDHFGIGVPVARAINPVTHTDWDGTGVTPDVRVPAGEALGVAQQRIQQQLQQQLQQHDGRSQP